MPDDETIDEEVKDPEGEQVPYGVKIMENQDVDEDEAGRIKEVMPARP